MNENCMVCQRIEKIERGDVNLIALAKLYEISVNELTNLRSGQK